jgi:hypothetical protein
MMFKKTIRSKLIALAFFLAAFFSVATAQKPQAAKAELGSETAKNGFRNETEIENKFNNWKSRISRNSHKNIYGLMSLKQMY